MPDLVERARAGEARAVARLISLVEDASPLLREVMARLAPYTGHAQIVGITGPPGVGKSTSTNALVRALRATDRRVGVLAVDPSSPFSGGALLGTGCACRTTPWTGRCTSARWPHGVTSAAWPGAPPRPCACWTPPGATWC